MTYDEWYEKTSEELLIRCAESGADREACFDFDRYCEDLYDKEFPDDRGELEFKSVEEIKHQGMIAGLTQWLFDGVAAANGGGCGSMDGFWDGSYLEEAIRRYNEFRSECGLQWARIPKDFFVGMESEDEP